MVDAPLLLATLLLAASIDAPAGEISGTAVNGTADESPLAGAEVVLRASQDGAFTPIAETMTDAQGRFRFEGLPVDQDRIYLAGVNLRGIHYPGPRVRLLPGQATAHVRLIAYETVESPSPLISRRHEIAVQPGEGHLEITETLLIENPSLTTLVGIQQDDRSPTTLRLAIPAGIEKVTFDREFHGRNFQLREGQLVTDLPWPPGSRQLKFIYRVPVEQRYAILERTIDQPTDHVVVRVTTKDPRTVHCNFSKKSLQSGDQLVFEHRGKALPAGYTICLQMGDVPLRFEAYARWLALAVLTVLAAGSMVVARQWRRNQVNSVSHTPSRRTAVRVDRARPRQRTRSSVPNRSVSGRK